MHSNLMSPIHWLVKISLLPGTPILLLMLRVYQSFNFDNLNSENQQSKFRPDMNTHQKTVHCQGGITTFHVPNE